MSNNDLTVKPPSEVSNKHFFREWLDLMRTTDRFLRAGLRRKIGPDGDLDAAVRDWYLGYCREHDDAIRQLVRNLHSSHDKR